MKSSFLFDGMLGRLCRKMRLLGYDARLAGAGESPRLLLDAEREGRVAVTASIRRSDRPGPAQIVLRRTGLAAQVAELFGALRSRTGEPPLLEPFTRCLECNVPLEAVPAKEVSGAVPERILDRCDRYVQCPSCRRIYWEGSHWEAMRGQVSRLSARLAAERLIADPAHPRIRRSADGGEHPAEGADGRHERD
ncbi:MAG: Mut7-C RNAse domain-containing protein [Candidatus Krumholzibacteria bacterium]|nr:Mut7-C RNAse domain-containing protein [Candidatus Krumholzibacteria bacterium]